MFRILVQVRDGPLLHSAVLGPGCFLLPEIRPSLRISDCPLSCADWPMCGRAHSCVSYRVSAASQSELRAMCVMRRFELGRGPTEDDFVVDCGGQKLVIDSVSHEFVKGATVDFADELIKSTFEVRAQM